MPTIEKRGSGYRITVSAGYDMQGKQIKKRMTWAPLPGMTEKQIQKKLERQKCCLNSVYAQGSYWTALYGFRNLQIIG